jgi:hypothetical protein
VLINVVVALFVVLGLAGITAVVSSRFPTVMRPWVWFALLEHVVCGVAQLIYSRVVNEGSDALFYATTGGEFARLMDVSFGWTARELLAVLFQRPSDLDSLLLVPGTNTSSMTAITGFLIFFCRGSDFGAHFLVTGMSLFAALAIYKAANEVAPEGTSVRMFIAIVLFPSVAFWTSALHKEAFGVCGIAALIGAWRAVYKRQVRALFYAALGLTLILLFRAPVLVPLLLGLVVFVAWDRLQKSRGGAIALIGPIYLAVGFGVVLLGMTAMSHMSPELSLDRLEETVATKQQNWTLAQGGSSFASEGSLPQTLSAQLFRVPLATLNALFRPQLFDVHNVATLISALEMTFITYLIYKAIRHHGFVGVIARIQKSPFALMCAVITLVGCTMVGLVTLNLGSLARYRVPFLPFYGALIVMLIPAPAAARVAPPLARRTRGTARSQPPLTAAPLASRLRKRRVSSSRP